MKRFFVTTVRGFLLGVLLIVGMHLFLILCQRQFRSWLRLPQPPPLTLPMRAEIQIANFVARYEIILAPLILMTCLAGAYVMDAYKKTG